MNSRHVLLVDDTKALIELYKAALTREGYQVTCAHSGGELFDILGKESFTPDLLILEVNLPDMDGLEILAKLRDLNFNAPVIVITGDGSIRTAVKTMRFGASDFLVKPFPVNSLLESVTRTLEAAGFSTKAEISAGAEKPHESDEDSKSASSLRVDFGGFIGISQPMQAVYDVIESAAKSNATVFITGESGTGKEICAEAIHRYSGRSKAPFIAINCAAIPRDLLESELFGHVKGAFTGAVSEREGAVSLAHGGTLFLDEIAEMAPDMQTKLLRFLQNLMYRKVGGNKTERANVRIICATNRDPLNEIKRGTLRQDLYYRLHVVPIHMPPLRTRRTDIIDLANYFLKLYAREENKSFRSFSPESERVLAAFSWPGNVRELQNIVRGIVVLHDARIVTISMLPDSLRQSLGLIEEIQDSLILKTPVISSAISPLWKVERSAIETAIAVCAGNIPRAAALLEISPSTIYRKKMLWDKYPMGPLSQDSAHF